MAMKLNKNKNHDISWNESASGLPLVAMKLNKK